LRSPRFAQPFQEQTGAKVIADLSGATSEVVAKVKASAASPQYDVVILSGVGAVELANAGLLAKPIEDLLPKLRVVPNLRIGANAYGVGYLLWTDGLVYGTRIFKEAPNSWRVLWDSKYKLFLSPPKWIEAMVFTIMAARLAGSDEKNPGPDSSFSKSSKAGSSFSARALNKSLFRTDDARGTPAMTR
jgi:putative spermidine/putrescine transport system substrate-binding protein